MMAAKCTRIHVCTTPHTQERAARFEGGKKGAKRKSCKRCIPLLSHLATPPASFLKGKEILEIILALGRERGGKGREEQKKRKKKKAKIVRETEVNTHAKKKGNRGFFCFLRPFEQKFEDLTLSSQTV